MTTTKSTSPFFWTQILDAHNIETIAVEIDFETLTYIGELTVCEGSVFVDHFLDDKPSHAINPEDDEVLDLIDFL